MFKINKYAGTGVMQGFVGNLNHNKGLRAALCIAATLLLLMVHPMFANGFILAIKILQGLSVLGSIFM